MRVLIVGCGYIGLPLGHELVRLGHEVLGIRRDSAAKKQLSSVGIQPLIADITRPQELAQLPSDFDWVINCVSASTEPTNRKSASPLVPLPSSLSAYRSVYLQGTRNLLDWLSKRPPSRFVYTSSTSVYGQTDGSWVDETSPTEPVAQTAKILVATEKLLLEAHQKNDFPAVILRLAGIYGPGRGYWFKQFLSDKAVFEGQGDRILNMIHRDDVVGAILAVLQHLYWETGKTLSATLSLTSPRTSSEQSTESKNRQSSRQSSRQSFDPRPPIYNVVDDEPVIQIEFFQWLAKKLSRPLPPSVPFDPTLAGKRGSTNKRVSNKKLRQELGYHLKFPTFREGYETLT
ncbi:MAG: hypothetical protein C5B50_23890 [Verrucomicrobia bacterium]|nr:MAG: hypothetical protein C5B50_23890 [Verrucomicrobiota bacterium]